MEDSDFLAELEAEIKAVLPLVYESSCLLREDNHSKFPIFTLSRMQLPFGTPIAEEETNGRAFKLAASTTEEFIQLGLIPVEKAKNFIATFKPAEQFACLFVVPDNASGARFVFYPYESE